MLQGFLGEQGLQRLQSHPRELPSALPVMCEILVT